MGWFRGLLSGKGAGPPHISSNNTADERPRRLATLSADEQKAYKWLFDGYSEAWTTETMGIEKADAKKLYTDIYRKLGVVSSREIVRYYAPWELSFTPRPDAEEKEDE